MSLIEVEALAVRYGRLTALDGVSFAVPEGSVYALLGRNGAGKSSLVRCLLGEQRPDAGRTLLLGRDAWRERAVVLAGIGVVHESPDAPPAMTAAQLSRFCARIYPRWDAAGFSARLRRFGVPESLPFGKLSRGQRGQVSLGLALAPEPRLLILDDPTLGLDPVARRSVFEELIGDLADRGTTVFLTSHDLSGVEGIADRVGILQEGRLVLDEEVETLKRRFRRISFPPGAESPQLAELAPVALASRGWRVEAVVSGWDDERSVLPAGAAAEVSALTLEEIFMALVGDPPGGPQ